ncbi:MAG TPA: 50S ribosomal protein L5 [bacterium]|nr:50S ribosomal protein L5 [bacterium]HPP86852.1 50S ribosomal protein L5 [bacterium]
MAIVRLKEKYQKEVISALKEKFGYKNVNQVPKLVKIVINMGLGKAIQDPKIIEEAVDELSKITGQKPVVTKSRKAISNFKLRQGINIGCMVTLRGDRMYEFYDRFVNIALPRVRDFRGVLPKSFDGKGNYSLGIKDHTIFPEINADKVRVTKGMDITIVTTAKTNEEAMELLKLLGMPFRKN